MFSRVLGRDRPICLFCGRYRYIGHSWTDTDHRYCKDFKSCILLHYQKYILFYALFFIKNFKNQDFLAKNFQIAAISIFCYNFYLI